jgi:hypothetical protein
MTASWIVWCQFAWGGRWSEPIRVVPLYLVLLMPHRSIDDALPSHAIVPATSSTATTPTTHLRRFSMRRE